MTDRRNQDGPGKLYGVGVGPGDPELMTIKAVRVIRECDILIVPGKEPEDTVAYRIARQAVPEAAEKELAGVHMPMTKDPAKLEESHREAAAAVREILDSGKTAAFLTLGDPCIYSTYSYIQKQLKEEGYLTEIINGIPSFLAASAAFNEVLTEGADMLHIIPATYQIEEGMNLSGTRVLMKCGRRLPEVRACIERKKGTAGKMIERCGMEGERIYQSAQEFPEESGYYSLVIVKDGQA